MSRELSNIGAHADGLVRSVAKLCQRVYALQLPRSKQREVLHALRKALNNSTRYQREPGCASLEQMFSMTDRKEVMTDE